MGSKAAAGDRAAITPSLVDRYRAGASLDQLAAWSGYGVATCKRWLIGAGVTMRPRTVHTARHEAVAAAREQTILTMISVGASNADIAAALHITPDTAKCHMSRLFRKYGVTCRAGLMGVAFRTGLLDPHDNTTEAA